MSPYAIGLPVLAAATFAAAALFLKQSCNWQRDPWWTCVLSSFAAGLVFQPLWLLGGAYPGHAFLWQPAVLGLLFLGGQITTVLGFTRGEVSVAAPVLGIKILLVAGLSRWALGIPLPGGIWFSCVLATAGVAVLNAGSPVRKDSPVLYSVLMGGLSALCFSLLDISVQAWSAHWGTGRLLPPAFLFGSICGSFLLPLCKGPVTSIPKAGRLSLSLGCSLMAVQSLLVAVTIAVWGEAPTVNVLYALRGLGSIGAIWAFGRQLDIGEADVTPRVLRFRLFGAGLLTAAVVQLFWAS